MTPEALKLGKEAQELRSKGDSASAKLVVERLIPLLEEDNPFFKGQIFGFYANLENDLENHESALSWYNKSHDSYYQGGFEVNAMISLRHVAQMEGKIGLANMANKHFDEVIRYHHTNDTPTGELANTIRAFAVFLESQGEVEKARTNWQEARELYKSIGLNEGVEECDDHLLN